MNISKTKLSQTILVFSQKYDAPAWALVLIVIGVVGRLVPHTPNFVPIGALALWAGFRLKPPQSYFYVLAAMFITDTFLGFHSTLAYVYGSLVAIIWLASRFPVRLTTIGGMTLTGALLFFLVTNFGVWQAGTMYPHTWAGLMQSYIAGLPFLRASLLGDVFYTALFFGAEWLVLTRYQKAAIVRKRNSPLSF